VGIVWVIMKTARANKPTILSLDRSIHKNIHFGEVSIFIWNL